MSRTLEQHDAITRHTNASTGSLSIRAQAQPESSSTARVLRSGKHVGNIEDIELTTLGRDALTTSPDGRPPPPDPLASTTQQHKWGARIQLTTIFWSIFTIGWNDGATGPLLPRIQQAYHVCHNVSSLAQITYTRNNMI
jgi:hypothetical protein